MVRWLLLFVVIALPARAYVRLHARDTAAPLFWNGPAVFTPDSEGCRELGALRTHHEIELAARNWLSATARCSELELRIDAAQPSPGRQVDGVNTIVWKTDEWGTTLDGALFPYGEEVIALTTLTYVDDARRPDNGRIVDSDTELNGVHRVFGVAGESTGALDVQSVVTHELGHALGLGHTCWDGVSPPNQPVDDDGVPVPDCFSGVDPALTETTMFPFSTSDDASQRTPEPDDVTGVCAIYPNYAEADGCAMSSKQEPATPIWWGVAAVALLGRRAQRYVLVGTTGSPVAVARCNAPMRVVTSTCMLASDCGPRRDGAVRVCSHLKN